MVLDLEDITHKCLNLIRDTATYIKAQQAKVLSGDIETKEANSFVTYVDKQAELMLVRGLADLVPEATFITEEQMVENQDSDLAWIIDPLDGTTNFLYSIPIYSISVALKINKLVAIGIVHAINQEESFYAWDKGGAFVNKKPIRVNKESKLINSLIGTGFPYDKRMRMETPFLILQKLLGHCRGVRRLGSAAMDLAYVASGRLDGYYESNLNTYDVAAGGKIILEAGGIVTDFMGNDTWITGESIMAANSLLHQELKELLNSVQVIP
jgi:myo-inositol-1(or 4)-monophosphatase